MALQQRFKKIPATPKHEERYLTPKRSAIYTGLSIDKVYEMIHARAIPFMIQPSLKNHPRYLIDKRDWDGWAQRRKIPAV
jgi:hypothetical protein